MSLIALTDNSDPNDIVSIVIRDTPDNLTMLYVLDALMKNVGGPYIEIISKYIRKLFRMTFESVDVPKRRKMFYLRQTWKHLLSASILFKLDRLINCLDEAWPFKMNLKQNFHMEMHNAEVS